MTQQISKIVIVGGGTAGWLTAGRIAAEHKENPAIEVTLIESPNIPTVGVGEGTWPTMRHTLLKLGISETDFIRECDASFKQGAKFAKWVDGSDNDFYYHPLMLPQGFTQGNLAPAWQKSSESTGKSFSESVSFQEAICELGLAPKTIRTPEFNSVANYAYHLNAGKFSSFLKKHCVANLSIKHVLDDVINVVSKENGDIEILQTNLSGELHGDLFIDCTGFKSLLLGEHLGIEFTSCSDTLFIDTALATQVEYDNEESAIASHTISTAQTAGWIWDIGLTTRKGVGHVYSSRHTSESSALQELKEYIGPSFNENTVRKIPIKSGHRKLFWKNNCVAVGLSAGFLEPLEASALVLVELSATMIAEQLPANRETMTIISKRFNETFHYRWKRIIDFLKLHYCISKRKDSQFWRDNCDDSTIPESLKELLRLWKYHSPWNHDFTSNNEVFPAASYQYVLYGMGFISSPREPTHSEKKFAQEQLKKNQEMIKKTTSMLPPNRELLKKIHQYGLHTV